MVQQLFHEIEQIKTEIRRLRGRLDKSFSGTTLIGAPPSTIDTANSAIAVIGQFTNASGGTVTDGDVVILDLTGTNKFTTTTTASHQKALGVVRGTAGPYANGALVPILIHGNVLQLKVTGSVSVGDYLGTSTTVKNAHSLGSSPTVGAFAIAETTPAAGFVSALVFPVLAENSFDGGLNYDKSGAVVPFRIFSSSDADITSGYPGGIQAVISLHEEDASGLGDGKWAIIRIGDSAGPIGGQAVFDPFYNAILGLFNSIKFANFDATDYTDPDVIFTKRRATLGFSEFEMTGEDPSGGNSDSSGEVLLTARYTPTAGSPTNANISFQVVVDDPETGKWHLRIFDAYNAVYMVEVNQAGVIKYINAPTSDPGVSGQLWDNLGVLMRSP